MRVKRPIAEARDSARSESRESHCVRSARFRPRGARASCAARHDASRKRKTGELLSDLVVNDKDKRPRRLEGMTIIRPTSAQIRHVVGIVRESSSYNPQFEKCAQLAISKNPHLIGVR